MTLIGPLSQNSQSDERRNEAPLMQGGTMIPVEEFDRIDLIESLESLKTLCATSLGRPQIKNSTKALIKIHQSKINQFQSTLKKSTAVKLFDQKYSLLELCRYDRTAYCYVNSQKFSIEISWFNDKLYFAIGGQLIPFPKSGKELLILEERIKMSIHNEKGDSKDGTN